MENIKWENIDNKDGFYLTVYMPSAIASSSAEYGSFFIAKFPCEIMYVDEVHDVAGTSANPVTLQVQRLKSGIALDSGDDILVTPFDLKGTARVVVSKSSTLLQNKILKEGDRLALTDTGTLTSLSDVCVTLYMKPLNRGHYRVSTKTTN